VQAVIHKRLEPIIENSVIVFILYLKLQTTH
jgi:hypothetical protein